MTNAERRRALNRARSKAVKYALKAELEATPPDVMSLVWAGVANALKDGSPEHDSADGHPSPIPTEYGVIDR